jgi:hypothetical protein
MREVVIAGERGRRTELDCALRIDASSPGNATLGVVHPQGTRVWLDGEPFSDGRVPPPARGRHLPCALRGRARARSVATALYVADNAEHAAWKRDNAELLGQLRDNPADPSLPRKLDGLLGHENDIRARDTLAASLGVLGGAALVGAALFAFWPDDIPPDTVVTSARDVGLRLHF